MKNLLFIIYIPLALAVVWGAIWLANIVIYAISFPISILGAVECSGILEMYPFWGFIYYAITTGIFYVLVFRYILPIIGGEFIGTGNKWLGVTLYLLLGFVIIAIYDPNVAGILPSSLQSLITFANEELYAYLLGGVNWAFDDFSGRSISPLQYWVFDTCIAAFFLITVYWIVFKKEDQNLNSTV